MTKGVFNDILIAVDCVYVFHFPFLCSPVSLIPIKPTGVLSARIYTLSPLCGCDGIGRHAGLRNQCLVLAGSSPVIRTTKKDLLVRSFFGGLLIPGGLDGR